MRERIFIATSVVLLFLAGCGQPAPDLNNNLNNNPNGINNDSNNSDNLGRDTVDINENTYGNNKNPNGVNDSTNTIDSNNITENTYTGNNSSADNFRSIYFDFDKYNIVSSMESNANHNSKVANSKSGSIKIEGNCDEFGTDEYNYALGLRRAKSVKDRMTSQGVDGSRIAMVSFGESNPICRDATDSCYDRNRRVDIRIAR